MGFIKRWFQSRQLRQAKVLQAEHLLMQYTQDHDILSGLHWEITTITDHTYRFYSDQITPHAIAIVDLETQVVTLSLLNGQ